MRICDGKGWMLFVYDLLYPGILGSMLYDVSELLRGSPGPIWFKVARSCIVLLYVMDYLHLQRDLRPADGRVGARVIIDALIPLFFAGVYWSMTREDVRWVFAGLTLIFALVLAYPRPKWAARFLYVLGKTLALVVSGVCLVVTAAKGFPGGSFVAYALGALAITYLLHVFLFTELARSQQSRRLTRELANARIRDPRGSPSS
jgi:hypothetical protein